MLPRRLGHSALRRLLPGTPGQVVAGLGRGPLGRGLKRGPVIAVVSLVVAALLVPLANAADAPSGWQSSNWTGVAAGPPVPGTGLPAAVVPVGTTPLPAEYDVDPTYEGQSQCDPSVKPGAQKLADLIKATYGSEQTVWIPRGCEVGGQSEHKEGRALDWMTDVRKAQERANAEAFLTWLLGPDAAGRPYGNAVRLGVMYVGWNDRIWRGYEIDRGWTELKGCFSKPEKSSDTTCHRNHIHISLTWDGATGTNSFWDGSAATGLYCPRKSTGATTPDEAVKGDMIAIEPVRVLSTADGVGIEQRCRLQQDRWSGDSHRIFARVVGQGAVPATGVSGVRIRLTAVQSNAPSTVRVWSPGQVKSQPAVKVAMSTDAAAEVVVPVASDGTIALATSAGATDLVVDVLGYYLSGASGPAVPPVAPPGGTPAPPLAPEPTDFFPLGSVVGYESATDGPLKPGEERNVTLAGVPAEARSALIFVTSKDATRKGSVRIGRIDDKNAAARFAFPKAKMHKEIMLVPVSGGQVRLTASKRPAVSLRVEVLGYGTAETMRTATGITPRPMLSSTFAAGETKMFSAAGQFGLPKKKRLKAVLLRVQTRKGAQDGTVSVFASDGVSPGTRSAPVVANTRYAAVVLAPVGADGRIAVTSSVSAKVRVSVVGYVT